MDIFKRFPRASWIGVILSLGIFGTFAPIDHRFQAMATLMSIAGLWTLFILALRVERRSKYAIIGLLFFGLFLLSVSTALPSLLTAIFGAV